MSIGNEGIQSSPLENIINVAITGGDFTSIEAALASITDNGPDKRYCIKVAPGTYTIDNSAGPIALKDYVGLSTCSIRSVILQPLTPTNDLFTGAIFTYLSGFLFTNNTTGWILNHSSAGVVNINDCVLRDCGLGFLSNNASAVLEVRRLIVNNPLSTTTSKAIQIQNGAFVLNDIIARSTSIITNFIEVSGATTSGIISNITTNSPNITTAIEIYNGALVSGSVINLNGPYDGILVYGNNTDLRFNTATIYNALNDGFRIDNTGINITFSLFATTITGAGNLNFNVLNPNSLTLGNGYTEVNNSYVHPDAEFYVYLLDLTTADESLKIIGELHVGTPLRTVESCFGGGDSFTFNMLVYTETAAGVFTDVSNDAKSLDLSTFTFPGTAAGNKIYIGCSLYDGTDYFLHHGIKVLMNTAGVLGAGNIQLEYWTGAAWVELNGFAKESSGNYLPYGKEYFTRAGSEHIRYDIVAMNDGSWVKNDPITPALGTSYFWVRFNITSAITTAPIFEQFKLHTSRTEINGDGFLEYFGNARPYDQLPISIGTGNPIEGNMQNRDIYFDQNLGVGHVENSFTAITDIYGWEVIAPNKIDTSSELALRFCGRPDTTESITFTIRWTWTSPDGTVYLTEPGAGSNPNSQSLTVTKSVTAGQLEWIQAYLDISNLIARRAADYPDTLCITIQPTTMGGNFALVGSQIYYLVCEAGGHAD